jgi:hypothetical protein
MEEAAFASPDFAVPGFNLAVRQAVNAGLEAAAILDAKGKPLAVAGALDNDEARAVAAHATRQVRSPELLERLLRGETLTASIGEREARIGIAAKSVFFVVVLPRNPAAMSLVVASTDDVVIGDPVDGLRSDIEAIIRDAKADASASLRPPPDNSGGSSSGPAELPVVELGVTVRRNSN